MRGCACVPACECVRAPDQSWHCVHPASLLLRSSVKPYPPSHRHQLFSLPFFINDSNRSDVLSQGYKQASERSYVLAPAIWGSVHLRFVRDLPRIWVWMERDSAPSWKRFPPTTSLSHQNILVAEVPGSFIVWSYQTDHRKLCKEIYKKHNFFEISTVITAHLRLCNIYPKRLLPSVGFLNPSAK